MACCCTNILELCKVPVCGSATIKTGVNVPEAGDYVLILDYLGIQVRIAETFEEGAELEFDASGLNEDYKYTGKIVDANGDPVSLPVGDFVYDCISFQTVLSFSLTA